MTLSVSRRTSSFQKRRTLYPRRCRNSVRRASSSTCSACCPPSTSTISLCGRQQKSTTYGPTGSWRRNLAPPICPARSLPQIRRSASVGVRRRRRPRSGCGERYDMDLRMRVITRQIKRSGSPCGSHLGGFPLLRGEGQGEVTNPLPPSFSSGTHAALTAKVDAARRFSPHLDPLLEGEEVGAAEKIDSLVPSPARRGLG